MEPSHVIRNFDFEISYPTESEAFAEHNRIGDFVGGRLITIADQVFSDLSPASDIVVRIDTLEVDLGHLAAASYYEDAEERFRTRLEEALRLKLADLSDRAPKTRITEGIATDKQHELDVLATFFETGRLPWNITTGRDGTVEEMLWRILRDNGPQFANYLRSTDRNGIARRLAWQLSDDLLVRVAVSLSPEVGRFITDMREEALRILGTQGTRADEATRQYWEFTLLHLMAGQGAAFNRDSWRKDFVHAFAADEPKDSETEQLAEQVEGLLEDAFISGDPKALTPFWRTLLAERSGLVEAIVRRVAIRPEVRRAMASGFPEPMLREIARLLEPEEIGFIEELTARPEVFREASAKGVPDSEQVLRARVWEFTFTYLLVERVGRLNQRAYTASVIRQMAARYNLRYKDLLNSLVDVMERAVVASSQRTEMLWLLSELEENEKEKKDSQPPEASANAMLLEHALVSGNPELVEQIWQHLVRRERNLVARTVRRLGTAAEVRHAMASGFGDRMLRDVVGILEPTETSFIERVTGEIIGGTEAPESGERKPVWEFTLTYLLVERGSRFNRRSYIGSVIRQMAAHENMRLPELLASLSLKLGETNAYSPLRRELLELLGELGGNTELVSEQEAADEAEILIRTALVTGDAAPILLLWKGWMRDDRSSIDSAVRRAGIVAIVRQNVASTFPEPILRDIADVLEPSEVGFIEEVTAWSGIFQPEGDVLKRRLWEHTFTWMLVERGSHFNRRSYLESMVRQMAAHRNLRYEDLLDSLVKTSMETRPSDALQTEMFGLLEEMQEQEAAVLLESAIGSADAAPLMARWPELRRESRARALRSVASRADVRSSLVNLLPEMMLRDLAETLLARQISTVEGVIAQESAPDARRKLWESTLEYLLTEPAGGFDKTSWLESMSRRGAVEPDSSAQRSEDGPGATDLVRSSEHYDTLRSWLLEDQHDRETPRGLLDAIVELRRLYPWQLSRILRELRAGSKDGGSLPASLSVEELRELTEAFLAVTGSGPRAMPERNGQRYYRDVLQSLIRNQPPDLDAPDSDDTSHDASDNSENVIEMPRVEAVVADFESADLASALRKADALSHPDRRALTHMMGRMLSERPEWLPPLMLDVAEDAATVRILAGVLPERQLAGILVLLSGPGSQRVQLPAELIVDACASGEFVSASAPLQRLKWQFLFRYLVKEKLQVSEPSFIRQFVAYLAEQNGYRDAKTFSLLVGRRLASDPTPSTHRVRKRILDALEGSGIPARTAREPTSKAKQAAVSEGEEIYIRNAGLVLAGVYLPRLFSMMDLLENDDFRDSAAAERATHLLQYMADETIHPPEHLLVLNKILCGLQPDEPVRRDIDLTQSEKDAVDGLLGAMIGHWKTIGNTSIRGLRESFLQREGRLRLKDGAWNLLVQQRAFDMLLDKLPWGFGVIKHVWMSRAVYVEWR
jgi:hypothetical protein